MAPSAVEVYPTTRLHDLKVKAQEVVSQQTSPAKLIKPAMQLTGALDKFESFDVTPVIGKEFPKANLAQWLEAPNADELIRDLAVTSKCLYSRHQYEGSRTLSFLNLRSLHNFSHFL
jgi:hypothetical protein